jgi:hypothetical protein
MDFYAVVEQVLALLQREHRLSYRVLKRRLQLDDETLEALKEGLIYAKHLAIDEEGKVLVWAPTTPSLNASPASRLSRRGGPPPGSRPSRRHLIATCR